MPVGMLQGPENSTFQWFYGQSSLYARIPDLQRRRMKTVCETVGIIEGGRLASRNQADRDW